MCVNCSKNRKKNCKINRTKNKKGHTAMGKNFYKNKDKSKDLKNVVKKRRQEISTIVEHSQKLSTEKKKKNFAKNKNI